MQPTHHKNNADSESVSYRELRLLEEVESTPQQSQRRLAHSLGIALGVANLLLRNLARKGYIRATRVGWKRWRYILTPAGVARKVHLTLAYVDRTLDHYNRVRALVRQDLQTHVMHTDSRVAIYGTTELAELLYLALRDMGVSRIEVFDREGLDHTFLGMPIHGLDSLISDDYVKIVVAFSLQVEGRCQELYAKGVSSSQVFTPLRNSTYGSDATDSKEA